MNSICPMAGNAMSIHGSRIRSLPRSKTVTIRAAIPRKLHGGQYSRHLDSKNRSRNHGVHIVCRSSAKTWCSRQSGTLEMPTLRDDVQSVNRQESGSKEDGVVSGREEMNWIMGSSKIGSLAMPFLAFLCLVVLSEYHRDRELGGGASS